MANLDYAAAAGASCGGKQLLCRTLYLVGPLTDGTATTVCCAVVGVLPDVGLASRKDTMFWTSEQVNWREEATGIGARK